MADLTFKNYPSIGATFRPCWLRLESTYLPAFPQLQVEEVVVNTLGRHLVQRVVHPDAPEYTDVAHRLPDRFCVEFVDLATIANKHRDAIGIQRIAAKINLTKVQLIVEIFSQNEQNFHEMSCF